MLSDLTILIGFSKFSSNRVPYSIVNIRFRKYFYTALYAFLAIATIWLAVATTRIFIFTQHGKKLIELVDLYQQIGDEKKSVLFIGDSFAYGTGASSSESTLAGRFGLYLPELTIVNKAANGTKSADLAHRIDADIDRRHDIIVVIIGANDIIHPEVNISKSRKYFHTIYAKASANADKVIAITTGDFRDVSFFLWPLNYYFGHRSAEINRIAYEESSAFENVVFIDAFEGAPVNPKAFESEDRLHPNDLGVDYWFRTILKKTDNLQVP